MGLALIVVWIVWAGTAALLSGHLPPPTSPYVVAPCALAVGVALGRLVPGRARPTDLQGTLLLLATLMLFAVLASPLPGKAPLGYANANAALGVQVIGLCGLAVLGANRTGRRVLGTAVGFSIIGILANASTGALAVTVPLLALIGVAVWGPVRRRRWMVLGGATAALLVAAQVVRLAGLAEWPRWADLGIDSTRRSLWGDARALWSQHPLVGSGPGSFARYSPLATDPDTSAAHSSVLQVGAETGWVGVALFGLVFMGALLWAAQGSPRHAVVGAATCTALVVQSFTDHLLDFPIVVLAAGLVLGWAGATGGSEELDVPEGQGPGPR